MRKYAIGFICGVTLATATTVYAGDTIKAAIFPVKYEVNGKNVTLPDGYETLIYNNRAYVPVRFVAEALGTVVIYNQAAGTIRLDDGFSMRSISSDLRGGYVQTRKIGSRTKVTAQLYAGPAYWESLYTSKISLEPKSHVTITANLSFYDEEGKLLAKLPVSVSCKADGDQLLNVEAETAADLSDYAFVSLENVEPEPIYAFLPPDLPYVDATGSLALGQTDAMPSGEFTKVRVHYAVLKEGYYRFEAELIYYDEKGSKIGTAALNAEGAGTGISPDQAGKHSIYSLETVGRGDFTKADRIEVSVKKMEKVTTK
ncbi:copper amine oxidase N-terminal domain-containing protein [Paenibacillus nanensis]|uniref:Copper amine oxidase N-terminal domain-containing protein n=1 Tax=Paenibacillus nanensis TaxID=393251 RepID=A0A3A1UT16_9BACL|nr:copper amine oxidase N-terminal domain-containing protein [Paenibacillus nanensis]RIX51679.1 copper amine oxidase N-terminal domain-containing protein [Paenibacillus nanensis]